MSIISDPVLEAVAEYFENQGVPELAGGYFPGDTRPAERAWGAIKWICYVALLFVAGLIVGTHLVGIHPNLPTKVLVVAVALPSTLAFFASLRLRDLRLARRGPGAPRRHLERVLSYAARSLELGFWLWPAAFFAYDGYIAGGDPVDTAFVVLIAIVVLYRFFSRRLADANVSGLVLSTLKAVLRGILATPRVATTIPAMLAVVIFLFITGDAWKLFGRLERWRFLTVVAAMTVLILVILYFRLPKELRQIAVPTTTDRLAELAQATAARPFLDGGIAPCPEGCAITRRIRFGLVAPVWFSLIARVFVSSLGLGLALMSSGVLAVSERQTNEFVAQAVSVHHIPRSAFVVSDALIQVVVVLSMLAALYYVAVSLGDAKTKQDFLEDEPVERVSRVIAAWAYYQGALSTRPVRFTLRHGIKVYRDDLRGMDLRGADLTQANLEGAQLAGAIADTRTKWPLKVAPWPQGVRRRRRKLLH
jgi:hypothetical protein